MEKFNTFKRKFFLFHSHFSSYVLDKNDTLFFSYVHEKILIFLYRLCLCPKEHFFHLLLQRRSVVLSSSSSHKLCIVFTNYYASHSLTFKKIQSSKLLSMRNVLKVKAQKQSHHMWSSHHLTPFSNRTA